MKQYGLKVCFALSYSYDQLLHFCHEVCIIEHSLPCLTDSKGKGMRNATFTHSSLHCHCVFCSIPLLIFILRTKMIKRGLSRRTILTVNQKCHSQYSSIVMK